MKPPCQVCGGEITNPRRRTNCSDECQREADRRALQTFRQARNKVRIAATDYECRTCGNSFKPELGRFAVKHCYCSDTCRKTADTKAFRKYKAEHGGNHRQRARFHGAYYEYVNRRSIYQRDNWTCQICGETIDPQIKFPNPRSASLDHIVPLSKGGNHVASNLQTAHFGCNSGKKDKAGVA